MDYLPAIVTTAAVFLARWPGALIVHWLRQKHGLGP